MSELKFKQTKSDNFSGKEINEGDLIAYNTQLGEERPAEVENKLGSTYRGQHIIGTTEAKKLCLNEDIKVMGVTVGNLKDGITLSKGDDLQTILQKILCKTIDVKAQAPTAVLSPTGNTDVEYGTVPASQAFTVTMTQGKFISEDPEGWTTNQAMDCKLADVKISGNAATIAENGMSATYTITGTPITAVKTINATATATANTVVPTKNDDTNSGAHWDGGSITVTGTKTWTPKFYYYIGYANKTTVASLTSADVKALNAKKAMIPMAGSNQTLVSSSLTSDGNSIIIAIPSTYKLSTVQNGVGADILGRFSETGQMLVACGGEATYNYNIYIYPITNGAQVEFKNVTLVKA